MASTVSELEAVVVAVRACFAELRTVGDAMHGRLGITSAMRSVMEQLMSNSGATVPDMARAKRVSRQNIQVLVDALIALGLVEERDNPEHKRSALIRLTRKGKAAFQDMAERERRVLARIASQMPAGALTTTLRTLNSIVGCLADDGAVATELSDRRLK
jgi:DNA-binding MarR family transcriptional regulator